MPAAPSQLLTVSRHKLSWRNSWNRRNSAETIPARLYVCSYGDMQLSSNLPVWPSLFSYTVAQLDPGL